KVADAVGGELGEAGPARRPGLAVGTERVRALDAEEDGESAAARERADPGAAPRDAQLVGGGGDLGLHRVGEPARPRPRLGAAEHRRVDPDREELRGEAALLRLDQRDLGARSGVDEALAEVEDALRGVGVGVDGHPRSWARPGAAEIIHAYRLPRL